MQYQRPHFAKSPRTSIFTKSLFLTGRSIDIYQITLLGSVPSVSLCSQINVCLCHGSLKENRPYQTTCFYSGSRNNMSLLTAWRVTDTSVSQMNWEAKIKDETQWYREGKHFKLQRLPDATCVCLCVCVCDCSNTSSPADVLFGLLWMLMCVCVFLHWGVNLGFNRCHFHSGFSQISFEKLQALDCFQPAKMSPDQSVIFEEKEAGAPARF